MVIVANFPFSLVVSLISLHFFVGSQLVGWLEFHLEMSTIEAARQAMIMFPPKSARFYQYGNDKSL